MINDGEDRRAPGDALIKLHVGLGCRDQVKTNISAFLSREPLIWQVSGSRTLKSSGQWPQ